MKKHFRNFGIGVLTALICFSLVAFAGAEDAPKPDPSGGNTGGIVDIVGASAGAPTTEEIKAMEVSEPLAAKVADVVGKNRIAINIVWTLVCGFLVMFMQAGFAMAETGFTRAKNAGHTMAMNFMVYVLGMLGYWLCGFALQMGGAGPFATLGGGGVLDSEFTISLFGKEFGLFGTKGFLLSGDSYDVAVFTMFLFQMVFMDTTATIPTGSMAERWSFKSFVIYGIVVGAIIYPLYANWVWGGGWLSKLGSNFDLGHGHVDFAGSSVVHLTGGVLALVGAKLLGPRQGKFTKDGAPNAIPGHHIPMAVVGCFILAFGWFGFNAGSTLAGTDLRIGVVAVNTMLAGSAGAFSSMIYTWLRFGKPDISMSANGLLAGLVAITAPLCLRDRTGRRSNRPHSRHSLMLGRDLCRASSQNRRPGGCCLRPRLQRRLGRSLAGAFCRWSLRGRFQRCEGDRDRPFLRRCRPARRAEHRHPDQYHLRRGDRLRRVQAPGCDNGSESRPRAGIRRP